MAMIKVIGGFRILQELQVGAGSQGTVYKAVCEEPREGIAAVGDVVALKVMAVQDDGQNLWRRLSKRTGELVRLEHPNVVKYKGCFIEPGTFADLHVVVQEFLDGETLKECLARNGGGLDVDRGLDIIKASLDALIYISGCGIVHRDIKPGNIFLCRDGSVKLIDFEIARQEGGTVTTAAGNIRGSFDYMAPDFIQATFHGDIQSDVFSMGVVMHEVLTGKTPYQRFDGDTKQANFAFLSRWSQSSSDGTSPIHISSRIKRLLANADTVLVKALAPDRNLRYTDFAAFREDMRAIRYRDLRNGSNTFRLLQYIGKGGFGEVFKARHRQTNQLVAVKHLLKAAYAERFFREAKILQKLQRLHDSCFVRFVDFFISDRSNGRDAFLVMEFLDGMPGNSLRDAIRMVSTQPAERLEKIDVLYAFRRYAHGLHVMHAQGIYHRDIKPSNLYYPEGHPERAAIMDLGIARDVNGTATQGQVPGTLDYMPPEVVLSENRGDSGMDIYALGLCFYEALTGKMGYPRLPTGTAAYTAFFARARANKPPVFDASPVVDDADLLSLLTEMTNPAAELRIKDASVVIERIDSIINRVGGLTQSPPTVEDEMPTSAPTLTIMLDDATGGTAATDMMAPEAQAQLEKDRRKLLRKRLGFVGGLACLTAAIGLGGLYFAVRTHKQPPEAGIDHSLKPATTNMTPLVSGDDRKAVGYVRFHVGEGVVCKFQEKEVVSDSRVVLSTGNYECVYYNLEKDVSGNYKYKPRHVQFSIAEKRVAEVTIPTDWERSTSATVVTNAPPVPSMVEIRIPALQDGIACQIGGEEVSGNISRRPGQRVDYSYWRRGYAYQGATTYIVSAKPVQELPAPGEKDWKLLPVRVWVPDLMVGATCWIGDMQLKGGSVSTNEPRATIACTYKRDGYKNVNKSYVVTFAADQILPAPEMSEWIRIKPLASPDSEAKPVAPAPATVAAVGNQEDESRRKAKSSVTNKCWKLIEQIEPVASRQKRLADAEKELGEAEKSGVLSGNEVLAVKNAIWTRRNWVVGSVANKCSGAIDVAGRAVSVGSSETFVFKDGLPRQWVARRPGYDDKRLPVQFDGLVVSLADSDFELSAVSVNIPNLPQGVVCKVDGEDMTGVFSRRPGQKVAYAYWRRGYDYRGQTSYVVTTNASQSLPPPSDSDWRLHPVRVWVPDLLEGATCWVNDVQLKGAGTNEPGQTVVCTYRRKGYGDIKKTYKVTFAVDQVLPAPGFDEWVLLPAEVKVPDLPDGVTCLVAGKPATGNLSRKPGERIAYSYVRKGYAVIEKTYLVTMEKDQALPGPSVSDWAVLPVKVSVPHLADGITCWVDGVFVSGVLRRKPEELISCSYRRKGYGDVVKSYRVTMAEDGQTLPPPVDSDWKPLPVGVWVPKLMPGASIWIGEKQIAGGTVLTNVPGKRISYTYRRKGYKPVPKTYEVVVRDYQELPPPTFAEWELLAVKVSVPRLPNDVTCWINGQKASGILSRMPQEKVECTYRREGFEDLKRTYEVTFEEEQTLPVPEASEWRSHRIAVRVADIPSDVTCKVDGVAVVGPEVMLAPGRHVCTYSRPDYEQQKLQFVIREGEPFAWPMPEKWVEEGALKFIVMAEEALRGGDPEKASELLSQVSSGNLSSDNERRKSAVEKWCENVSSALTRYEQGDWSGCLEHYKVAADAGYRLSKSDWELVEESYSKAKQSAQARIKAWEEWLSIPSPMRPPSPRAGNYDRAREDLKNMTDLYERCKRARRM